MKRIYRVIIIITMSLMVTVPQFCYADEKEEPVYEESEDRFESLKNGMTTLSENSFKDINIEAFLPSSSTWENAMNNALDASSSISAQLPAEFNKTWNSLSGAKINDLGSINLQYTNLQSELALMGWGQSYSLEKQDFALGYSKNVLA